MKRIQSIMTTLAMTLLLNAPLAHSAAAEIRESPPSDHAPAVEAAGSSERSYWGDVGYGSLAVISNIFYMPVKVVYAVVGLPVGALAYVLTAGDSDISGSIWGSSLGGDYVITPGMLLGERPISFNGRATE